MSYSIKRYTNKFYDQWNGFVEDSNNGTIFHRMDFNYHGHKFSNEHSLVFFKEDSIVALMPLSIFKKRDRNWKITLWSQFWRDYVNRKLVCLPR